MASIDRDSGLDASSSTSPARGSISGGRGEWMGLDMTLPGVGSRRTGPAAPQWTAHPS